MRMKFTFKTQTFLAASALIAGLLVTTISKAQALFQAGRTYYVNGSGVDLVAPKDTFISLAGTGTVYTGGAYTTNTGIFPALSVNGIDSNTLGQITILLVPGYTGTETLFPVIKGVPYSSPLRPIILRPNPGTNFNISRSTYLGNEAVIRLEGTQFFTIDGEGTAGQRNITFTATNGPANNHRVIDLVSTSNTAISAINTVSVKNCNLMGVRSGANAVSQAGIFIGSTNGPNVATFRRSENVSIINCDIQNVQYGIYARGISSTFNATGQQDKGLTIIGNRIGGAPGATIGGSTNNLAGILLHNQANVIIENNTISGCDTMSAGFSGIYLTNLGGSSLDSNVYINANKIYNFNLGYFTPSGGAGPVCGIRIAHNTPRTTDMNYVISNNVISNIGARYFNLAQTGIFPAGISIEENTTNASVDIYNNSISLSGAFLATASPNQMSASACILVSASTTGGIQLINNVLSNRSSNQLHVSSPYQVYGVYVNNNSEPFDSIDNNLYDISTGGGWALVGRNNLGNYASLGEWQEFTNDDENSTTIRPVFNDPFTLATTDGAPTLYGRMGRVLVYKDINGVIRPTNNQSIGAYQFNGDEVNANSPLMGGTTYLVNGINNFPTASNTSGSFKNLVEFADYLNSFGTAGISDTIKIVISTGYPGDTAVIPAINAYPGMSATRKINLRVAAGVTALITLPSVRVISGNSALFRLNGVSDFTIDGRDPANPAIRAITFLLPASANIVTAKVIIYSATATRPVSRNTILNCNILGSSNTTSVFTSAGIYFGDPFVISSPFGNSVGGPNTFNIITNNFIGGVRTGLYTRAKAASVPGGAVDQVYTINNNVIGGYVDGTRTNQIGGADAQAGIYIKGLQSSTIDSNIIRNSLSSGNAFRGIDLDGTTDNGKSQNLSITRNTIVNLGSSLPSNGYAIGIRVALNEAGRNISIVNNFIAKIYGSGSTSFNLSPLGGVPVPSGISIDPLGVYTNLGITIGFNTVSMSQHSTVMVASGCYTTAFFVGTNVGGISLQKNVFANTSGRNTIPFCNTTAIAFGSTNSNSLNQPGNIPNATAAFTNAQGNVYYARGTNSYNYVGMMANTVYLNQLYSINEVRTHTNDALASFGEVPFLTDTTIDMDLRYCGHVINARNISPSGVTDKDITGKPRNFQTSVGAIEITPVHIPLKGGATYFVNGVLQPPTTGNLSGQFNTINNLFRYINTNGVDDDQAPPQDIIVEITNGYTGEGDTLISMLHDYPLMSFNRKIIIRPAAGASPVIVTTADSPKTVYDGYSSVIKFQGAQYVTIDGSNNGSDSRNLTIRMPYKTSSNLSKINNTLTRVIDVVGWGQPALGIQIKNCNIIGFSDTLNIYTYAGIYQGGINYYTAAPAVPFNPLRLKNNDNVYSNNNIVAVRYGIQLRGNAGISGGQDFNNVVRRNTIGGTIDLRAASPTDFFGGVVNAAGISAAAQAKLLIDSNLVRNNIRTYSGNSGIELINGVTGAVPPSAGLGTDSAVTVSRNTIQQIRTTNSANAYGIYVNVASWSAKRSYNIVNNMISGISAVGANLAGNIANNPYGIFLNGALNPTPPNSNSTELDVNFYHNSINLGGTVADTLGSAGVSACIGIAGTIRGDIRMENNILQNRLTRTAAGGPIYAILTQSNVNPFLVTDNNNYYVGGANSVNHIAGLNAHSTITNYTTFNNWANLTQQDTMSLNYPVPFTSANNLLIPDNTASTLYHAGRRIINVANDVLGAPRPLQAFGYATIGAHEFNGIYADSSAPKVYDNTLVPPAPFYFCQDFTGEDLVITARVMDRNPVVVDTMFYRLNGGPESFILPVMPVNGFDRTYRIPAGPNLGSNTFVTYRFGVKDGSDKTGRFMNPDPIDSMGHVSTMVSNYPMAIGFDLPNRYGLRVEQIDGTAKWNLTSYGSLSNPFLFPMTGARAALLPASNGSSSRIITPCLDFTTTTLPILRLYVSQNYDNTNLNDSIIVRSSAGFGVWNNLNTSSAFIGRANLSYTTPGYKVYDVCLTSLVGFSGLKLGIEGYSRGGGNLLIDSIILLDNFVDHTISPATQQSCFNDSFKVDVFNSSSQNSYYLFDELTQRVVGPQLVGNGGTLTLAGYLSTADSAHIKVKYINLTSGCEVNAADLNNISRVYFGTFKNGPFVRAGAQFYGKYNDGTVLNPDAVRVGGTADFEIIPPGGKQNADYGTTWTVSSVDLRNTANNLQNNGVVSIVPAGPSTPAYVRFNGVPADSNKLFRLNITLTLLPDGCDSIISRLVRVANAPVAIYYTDNDTLCQGENIQFYNATTNGVFTLPVNYQWDFGDGTTSNLISPVKKFSVPGNYRIRLIATNSSTLVDSMVLNYVVNPAPSASYTATLACADKPVKFTNTGTSGPDITYSWNIAGYITDTRDVDSAYFHYSDTTVNVSLKVTNGFGCSATAKFATTVFAQPTAAFTANSVCAGASVQFNNASTIAPGKNGRINTIGSEWQFGNGDVGYANNPLYKYPAGGNYKAILKVISNFGCTDTVSAPVSVFDKPVSSFTIDNTCKASNVVIVNNSTFSGGLDKVRYNWNFGDNSPSSNLAVPVKQYGEARAFFITLTVMDTVNHCSDSMTKTITVKESAKADFTTSNGCVNAPVVFTNVSVVPPGVTPTFAWEFGDGGVSGNASTTHTYATGGDKNVKFTVDVNGCKSVANKTISISSVQPVTFQAFALDNDSTRYKFVATPGTSTFSTFTWNFGDNNQPVTRNVDSITNLFTKAGTYTVTLIATDGNGCSSTHTLDVVVRKTVGVKEDPIAAKFNFNLYPNPFETGAQVTFNVDSKKDVTLEVYDMLGRKVFTHNAGTLSAGNHSIELSENDFSAYSAAYLVKVQIGNEVITRQLIKK
jgi:PKD repeat protein